MQRIERYEIVAISDEFLKLVKELPELSTAKWVEVSGKRIEGPKTIMVVATMEEIEQNLPAIAKELADPENNHLRIIKKIGSCYKCKTDNPNIPIADCPHINELITINQAWNVDVQEILAG